MKIGAITIGQAPRTDVTADIMRIFDGKVELLQRGGLDGLTKEEIARFAPEEGDYVLVSRLTDGSSVKVYIQGDPAKEAEYYVQEGGKTVATFAMDQFGRMTYTDADQKTWRASFL